MTRIVSSFTHRLPQLARIALGLVFVVFGLNGFLQFLPQPPLPEAALPFITGLAASGYLFPVLKATEVAAGLMLLASWRVPLALTLLAPIVVNIALFHLVLAPALPMVALLLTLEIYLAWAYRDAFAPMLRAHVAPRVGSERDGRRQVPAGRAVGAM